MNKDDLMPFCEASRKGIAQPWSAGDYTYATNGRVLIRIPRLGDVPECALAPKAAQLFNQERGQVKRQLAEINFIFIPEIFCPYCNGAGKLTECPECHGDGKVIATNFHNDYEVDCATCGGTGKPPLCEICVGTGKIISDEPHKVGKSWYQKIYLELLKTLPDCVLYESYPKPLSPAYFRFNGGDGLLMPMRPSHEV
jgi:hypothetical protein